ncbi:tRNA dimethylallyltransferase [Methylomarinovum tepidoasis]|uniref:tRNA dimethylallyltransferase n=1 Tax=Methylomarinovum tepidoasis TaxID=2840183 RepID=A0AAU9BZ25_9GAMM|nr:tRNA (adenosine(37)-N6)-dimethylallyltransferase MiaA [Methylomarinovum sp. IN45]BCX89030.1 tRNA dimethylallyltransferase [Methylomarinovum sp. IN45]
MSRPKILLLMGPTAAGKSDLAIELARRVGGEIVSVDSSLVYRGMDIGTAKPPPALRAEIPHHLVDILDPAESYSAGRFRRDALAAVEAILARGRRPILVGGTMLYFNALLRGIAPLPPGDAAVRAAIDREAAQVGWAELHRRLAALDPEAAARIHPNDPQRIQRALEVWRLTGRPLSGWWRQAGQETLPFRPLKVVVAPRDRQVLHHRIEARFHAMLEAGLVEEVERLYRRGDLHPGLPSMRSVGYRQVWAYLAGEYDYAAMIDKAVIATRQLAKRQFTWLRRERDALWLDPVESGVERILAALSD